MTRLNFSNQQISLRPYPAEAGRRGIRFHPGLRGRRRARQGLRILETHAERCTIEGHQSHFLESRLERLVTNFSVSCGRTTLAGELLETSDVAKHVTAIRNCAAGKNLRGALEIFEPVVDNGLETNSIVYNAVLDACVECREFRAAEA